MSDKIERIIDALRKKILESAIRGELVPQNPEDEPASKLLERIAEERERLIKEKKIKKPKSSSCIFRRDGHFYESINGGTPTCIDDDIPFDIPDSWEWVRARSIVSVERGGSPRPIKAYITESEDGINWIKIGDSKIGSKYIYSTKEKIKPDGVKRSRTVKVGDLLLSNSMSFGRAYILRTNGCIHDGWLVLHPYLDSLNREYLYYLFASITLANQFKKLAKGSTVSNLNEARVSTVLIPLPPILEQKTIVSAIEQRFRLLNAILETRVRYRRILSETPTSLRQQLIQAAIQGQLVSQNPNDEPASVLLERIAEERASKQGKKAAKSMSRIVRRGSKTYELFPDGSEKDISDEIPFEIPDSWEWSTLGIVSINRDSERIPLSKAQRQGHSKIYDYYGASGVIDKVERYLYDSRLLLIGEDGANLLSRSTDIAFIAEGKYWVNNHAHVLDSHKGISLDYIKHYINGISLVKYVTGSAQPKLTQDNLNAIIIPVPPADEQLRIVEKIESILSTIAL